MYHQRAKTTTTDDGRRCLRRDGGVGESGGRGRRLGILFSGAGLFRRLRSLTWAGARRCMRVFFDTFFCQAVRWWGSLVVAAGTAVGWPWTFSMDVLAKARRSGLAPTAGKVEALMMMKLMMMELQLSMSKSLSRHRLSTELYRLPHTSRRS